MGAPVSHGADEAIPAWRMRVPNMKHRVVEIDGEPWFLAMDSGHGHVHRGRGAGSPALDADEVRLLKPQQFRDLPNRGANAVTESGLYALILRSRKPEARAFRKWVASVHPKARDA